MNSLLSLPDDVLEKIMSFITYDEVSRIRMVSRRFNYISQRVLTRGFHKVEKYHAQCLRKVKAQLPRRESERRKHPLARHCDILTAVETRLSLLGMTFMKFIDLNYCCFIPGKVLDEIYRVLRYVTTETMPIRAHEVLQELRDLSSMAMEYFDEKIAPSFKKHKEPVPKIVSGISFLPTVRNSSRSCSGNIIHHEQKFQRMCHFIRQMIVKQNNANKEITALNHKVLEVKKKNTELEKKHVEQQNLIASQSEKLKEHEMQLLAIVKQLRLQSCLNPVSEVVDPQVPCCSYQCKQETIEKPTKRTRRSSVSIVSEDIQDPCCSYQIKDEPDIDPSTGKSRSQSAIIKIEDTIATPCSSPEPKEYDSMIVKRKGKTCISVITKIEEGASCSYESPLFDAHTKQKSNTSVKPSIEIVKDSCPNQTKGPDRLRPKRKRKVPATVTLNHRPITRSETMRKKRKR